jgi:hypothetical protein
MAGYQTWSVILRGKYRFGMCENRALKKIFQPKLQQEARKTYVKKNFIICTLH